MSNTTILKAKELELFVNTPVLTQVFQEDVGDKKRKLNVFLKLDCLQPSGSFKDRGIGISCT